MATLQGPHINGWGYLSNVDARLHPLLPRLRAFLDDALADTIGEMLLQSSFPEHSGNESFAQLLQAAMSETMDSLRRFLCGVELEQIRPGLPTTLGATQARLDISEGRVQQSYRLACHTVALRWMRLVESETDGDELSSGDALAATEAFLNGLYAFEDHLMVAVSAAHAREREVLAASGAHVRQRLLKDIVGGTEPLDEAEVSATLNYSMNGEHLALILSKCPSEDARHAANILSTAIAAGEWIVLPLTDTSTAVWLSRQSWTRAHVDRLLTELRSHAAKIALGTTARGVEGFRSSFHQAQQAEAVRLAWGDDEGRVIQFEDVQLEVMALRNPAAARMLVQRELGELAEMSTAAEKLRETMRVWFALGSHVSAAARLGLHEHTVRNRIRRVETILGHSLFDRRTDVQVALRLHRLFGADIESAADGLALNLG